LTQRESDKEAQHLGSLRWVIGTPYFVQGTTSLTEIPILYFIILQLFVYISLLFTLLTIPFIEMLRRELEKRGIRIRLGDGS
jgi:hypothetical protein